MHAHRCLLTARCEAFRVMFNSSMREGSHACPQVPILEASYGAFHCMLQFIYGGAAAADVGEELAVELLGLADRYLLDGLKLLCGFTLARMISVESVINIFMAADRWDTPRHAGAGGTSQLKQRCLDYILAHYKEARTARAKVAPPPPPTPPSACPPCLCPCMAPLVARLRWRACSAAKVVAVRCLAASGGLHCVAVALPAQVAAAPAFEELTTSPHLLLEISRAAAPLVQPRASLGGSPYSAGGPDAKRQRRLS